MTRARQSTLFIKRRAIQVERKPIAPRASKAVAAAKPATNYAEKYSEDVFRPILAEVERCLVHDPLQFPRKLWGDII